MKYIPHISLLVTVVTLLVTCQNNRPRPEDVVARVGEAYLTRQTIKAIIPEQLPEESRQVYLRKLVDDWVRTQLLAQEARRSGIDFTIRDRWAIESLKRQLLSEALIANQVPTDFQIPEKEVRAYYETYKEEFKRDKEEVHLVHLFLEKRDRAIEREIKDSKNLQAVIEKNFLDQRVTPLMEKNGDLGYLSVENLKKPFRWYINRAKVGDIVGPIKSNNGYHFFQVLDRQPAGSYKALELVRAEIVARLKIEHRHKLVKELVDQLRRNAEVQIFLENFNWE